MVTAGSRQSPQVNIVATIARAKGLPCRVHVPSGDLTPELRAAAAAGAEIVAHPAGRNSVIRARAREDAAARGWLEIPFGMECERAVDLTAAQVCEIPEGAERIVVPVGSGMTLAGILWGLEGLGLEIPVLGVQVGGSVAARLDRFAPAGWRERVELVPAGLDYHDHAPETRFEGVELDPVYEAKCVPFLRPNDLLWVVGRRATAGADPGEILWITGDSRRELRSLEGEFDAILSCPPYADLERYSEDPADISNMAWPEFRAAYREIIALSVGLLRDNAFAVWVVGDVRSPGGAYRGLIRETIEAFEEAGASLWNEAILVSQVGSLPIRAARPFLGSRKLAKCHQNVLIFAKGDAAEATRRLGEVEVFLPDPEGGETPS